MEGVDLKYLVYGFNFIFLLIGGGVAACGTVILLSYQSFLDIVGTEFTLATVLTIALGAVICAIALLGTFGALTDNYKMVGGTLFLLGVIFILEMTVVVLAFFMQPQVDAAIKSGLTASMDHYTNSSTIQAGWDRLQSEFRCCGVRYAKIDWAGSVGIGNMTLGRVYPKSCCYPKDLDNYYCGSRLKYAFDDACLPKLRGHFDSNGLWIGGVAIAVSIFPLLGTVPYYMLMYSLRGQYQKVE